MMDDLDRYINEQMENEEFQKEWKASQRMFEIEELKITANKSLRLKHLIKYAMSKSRKIKRATILS